MVKDMGYIGDISAINNYDKTKNYKGLVNTDGGLQWMFLQFGGVFAIQLLFCNRQNKMRFRINFGEAWSSIRWSEISV